MSRIFGLADRGVSEALLAANGASTSVSSTTMGFILRNPGSESGETVPFRASLAHEDEHAEVPLGETTPTGVRPNPYRIGVPRSSRLPHQRCLFERPEAHVRLDVALHLVPGELQADGEDERCLVEAQLRAKRVVLR